jgi:hypothetical protein
VEQEKRNQKTFCAIFENIRQNAGPERSAEIKCETKYLKKGRQETKTLCSTRNINCCGWEKTFTTT